jgi:(5-formylfuran-3-yl)methyl phosphate synthase
MTGMLASVSNLHEAKIAFQENVDIIDLKDPAQGALGAVTTEVALEVVEFVSGQCLVSATIGDLPMQATLIGKAIATMASTGVDIVKVGVFDELTDDVIASLRQQAIKGAKGINGKQFTIVIVFFVDKGLDSEKMSDLAKAGIRGVMLDTADKTKGNLRTHMQDEETKAFVVQAKSYGLLAGLAGSLKASDIAPLLELEADYLGFRGALCQDDSRIQALNSSSVRNIRSLITNAKDAPVHVKAGLQ